MKKGIISRIISGVKKGIFTHTLPDHIIQFNNQPIIRIFRVLGGISIILIFTHRLQFLGDGILYFIALMLCTILAILFSIYLIFLTYHRIKNMIKVFKSDELDVKNSPTDRLASLMARIIWCSRGFCETAAPFGVVFGGLAGIDELRKAKGLEPIFLPKLANLMLPNSETDDQIKQMRFNEAVLANNKKELDFYKEESDVVSKFEEHGIISKDEANTWRNQIARNESLCKKDSTEVKSKILETLKNLEDSRRANKK